MADISNFESHAPIRFSWANSGDLGLACDAQNEAIAFIFQMPVDDTITHVIFTNNSKTGTPANDSYTVSLQGVATTGNPDGTILGGGTPASATFPNATYPAADFGSGTGHVIALANSIALQRGTFYTMVIQKTGATDASNFLNFRYAKQFANPPSLPHAFTADATPTWTKDTNGTFFFGVRSATRTYFFPAMVTNQANVLGTTTENGFTFTLPSGFGASNSYTIRGVRLYPQGNMTTGATFTMTLYTTPLGTPAVAQQLLQVDSDYGTQNGTRAHELYFPEDSLVALTPGTKYGIGFSHSSASGWSVGSVSLPDANCRDAYPMGGLTYCTRTLTSYPPSGDDTNAFTETTTKIVIAELLFAEFTAAAGSGTTIAGTPMLRGMV